jgi:hypothetical protein
MKNEKYIIFSIPLFSLFTFGAIYVFLENSLRIHGPSHTLYANNSDRNSSLGIKFFYIGKISYEKIQKNVGIIPWEKFRVHSALVPSKISIQI